MTRHAKSTGDTSATPITIPAIPPANVLGRLAALKAAATEDLKQQWRELFGAEPPPHNRAYLQSRLAYRVQELAYGGLKPETVARLEALGEQLDGGNITLRRIRGDDKPIAGTRLIRQYQSVEHTVTVLQDGYEWQGRPYRSLSAIARAIVRGAKPVAGMHFLFGPARSSTIRSLCAQPGTPVWPEPRRA
jgi:hypothetical protein